MCQSINEPKVIFQTPKRIGRFKENFFSYEIDKFIAWARSITPKEVFILYNNCDGIPYSFKQG